ncbi:MAG TPA: ATP-dependent Clp protease proteolytic subunit, partial [Candidatus Brocadiia bacterium]|nr:ATP-dependent Clp protease proteolytic subunit [Candidatus Brocadiia bacterium]
MERRAEQERGAFLPTVVERTGRGERAYDLFSRLLEDRIVFLGSVIDDVDANLIVAQLLYLQSKNKNADINMYVNSLGG